ncbi:hypothetical protein J4232_06505 [Candidatus Woesearchaeota archaeon]|nr:hypothetical protein [Candidatus Woesearchaeota archaeon]
MAVFVGTSHHNNIDELVVTLDKALNSSSDSIIQELNPGYTRFLNLIERFSPNIVLVGGHRVSGKTTIVDKLIQINPKFGKVQTHVTREERRTEKVYIPTDHVFVEMDDFIKNFHDSQYAFAYSFHGNLYGIPNDALTPLRMDDSIFKVIGVVNPFAFQYLLQKELFPNAMNVVITTTSKDEKDIKERITIRCQREKINNQQAINQAIDSVISDKKMFSSLNPSVDIIIVNNGPEIDTLKRSITEVHALRIEEYMKWHKSRSLSGSQRYSFQKAKPDKMRISNYYIDTLMKKLFSSDYSLPVPGNSVKINLKTIKHQIVDYVFRTSSRHKLVQRATYNQGILYRNNGLLQLLFPQVDEIPAFELDNLTPLNRTRFGTITSFLGNYFIIDGDGKGVYYALSDIRPESPEYISKLPYMLYIGFRNLRDIHSILSSNK